MASSVILDLLAEGLLLDEGSFALQRSDFLAWRRDRAIVAERLTATERLLPQLADASPEEAIDIAQAIAMLQADSPVAARMAGPGDRATLTESLRWSDISPVDLQPVILAGDPLGTPPDSADLRIDANVSTSPYAGVGSVSITAPGIGDFLCTGTVISPRHVLTAAHCLDVEGEDGIIDVLPENVTFTLNVDGDVSHQITASALAIFDNGVTRYEGFSNSLNNDLAILTLSEALPPEVPIYDLLREPLPPQSEITLVGYGTSGDGIVGQVPGTASATVKRVGQNIVEDASSLSSLLPDIDEIFLYDFDGPTPETNSLAGLGSGLTLGNTVETTVGPGDSGGPSFVAMGETLLLAGVNTFAFAFPNFETPESGVIQGVFGTGGGGVQVSDPDKLAWIDSFLPTSSAMGSLHGINWHDLNGDGDRDPAEPILPDWTVYLDLNNNGVLDTDEPTTLTDETGAYHFTDLSPGNYTVAMLPLDQWQQTFPSVGTVELLRADFSENGVPSLDGFTIDNTSPAVPGLWDLTTGRGTQVGHSPEASLYFGQNETLEGGGNYDVGRTAGRVTSPILDLRGLTAAELTFNDFLNVEPDLFADLALVKVSKNGEAFQTIASKGNGLNAVSSATLSWTPVNLDLSEYVGSSIQVQFDFDTVDALVNTLEGWFIDDVVVQGTSSGNHSVTLAAGEAVTNLDFGNILSSPDLLALEFDTDPDAVLAGGQTSVSFTLLNQGTGTNGSFDVNLVYSDDAIIGNGDDQILQTLTIAGLAAGESLIQTVDLLLPLTNPPGTGLYDHALREDLPGLGPDYVAVHTDYLGIVIDPTDQIVESDELNNFNQGQGFDQDDITYFPWDIDRNGEVTPSDAIFVINRLGQSSTIGNNFLADINANGLINPSDAIAVINRLGYSLNTSVIETGI